VPRGRQYVDSDLHQSNGHDARRLGGIHHEEDSPLSAKLAQRRQIVTKTVGLHDMADRQDAGFGSHGALEVGRRRILSRGTHLHRHDPPPPGVEKWVEEREITLEQEHFITAL
jgi:hypothetical protein